MGTPSTFDLVCANLKTLKLATLRECLDAEVREAQSQSLSHLEFLYRLTTQEIQGREASNYRRRLRGSKIPVEKKLEDFDFSFQPSLAKDKILPLKDCRWVANAENILLAGQSGTGKTHLAIALGLQAIQQGYRVFFSTVADLLDQHQLAQATGQVLALEKRLFKHEVIILDELGYVKINRAQGNFLFRLVSKAYESFSLVLTTNKDFSGWAEIFEDRVQVAAMLDRLLHHAVIFKIKGESYRVRHQKVSGKGKT